VALILPVVTAIHSMYVYSSVVFIYFLLSFSFLGFSVVLNVCVVYGLAFSGDLLLLFCALVFCTFYTIILCTTPITNTINNERHKEV